MPPLLSPCFFQRQASEFRRGTICELDVVGLGLDLLEFESLRLLSGNLRVLGGRVSSLVVFENGLCSMFNKGSRWIGKELFSVASGLLIMLYGLESESGSKLAVLINFEGHLLVYMNIIVLMIIS